MHRFIPLLALLLGSGCAEQHVPPVMACPTLPTVQPSVRPDPLPPVSETPLTLQPGHWDWADGGYFWSPAAWVPRRSDHPMWMAGYWTPNGGACVWNPGHFVP